MKKEVKDLWVEALRSGKFEQGKSTLQKEGKFCCLGVLCMIAPPELLKLRTNGMLAGDNLSEQEHVRVWSGIKNNSNNGDYRNKDNVWESSLTWLNDSGKSFEEIADKIEEVWETL